MLNNIVLIGRLTKDVEERQTPNGVSVAQLTLAVNRRFNKEQTDFIDCICWRQQASFAGKYGTKGRLVAVEGELQTRTYETKEGQKRKAVEVLVENLQFLDKAKTENNSTPNPAEQEHDPWDDLGKEVRLEDLEM